MSAFRALLRRVNKLACLRMSAEIERAYTGRAGPKTAAWFRVRPRLAGPKGRLP